MRRFILRATRSGRRVGIALAASALAGLTGAVAAVPSATPATPGYYLVGTDGGIFSFGAAHFMGSTGDVKLNKPIVGMAATPDGKGYWMVASDGGIFAFGSAGFFGSTGATKLNQPIVGMAATRSGKGYWLVASDGGIFAFGDAGFFGSTGSVKLAKPIIDIFPTPTGRGYWMAASDGGIFAFGDAGFFGSTGSVKLAKRIQQMAATPTGRGYWLVAGDGGIFAFGDAKFHGSAVDGGPEKRIVDMAPSASGLGYYLTASNGAVYAYGDAKPYGGLDKEKLAHGIIAMVALNGSGEPPTVVNDVLEIDEDVEGSINVLANDRDPDGTPLSIQSVSGSMPGATLSVSGGTVTYKPAPDANGTDTFFYTAVDNGANTAVGAVTVQIRPIDDLPRTADDSVTVDIGQPATVHVLANDTGLGDGLKLLRIWSNPAQGTATVAPDGRSITYTGSARGEYSLTYQVEDRDGDNNLSVLKIKVRGPDKQPQAIDITHACRSDCKIDVLTKGATVGDGGKVSLVSPPAGVGLEGTSTIRFTRPADNFGNVEVKYQIEDDDDDKQLPEVSVGTVTFVYANTAPTAADGEGAGPAYMAQDFQLQSLASDPDGDSLTFWEDGADPGVAVSIDTNGVLHFGGAAPGTVIFAPPGTYTVKFHVVDAHGVASSGKTYTITLA